MKKPKPPNQPDPDAEALGELIRAMVVGMGRGGLSYCAKRLGMTPSAFRKRLLSPGAGMDAVTFRAIIMVEQSRANPLDPRDEQTTDAKQSGPYLIDRRDDGSPTWRNIE